MGLGPRGPAVSGHVLRDCDCECGALPPQDCARPYRAGGEVVAHHPALHALPPTRVRREAGCNDARKLKGSFVRMNQAAFVQRH